jgi:DNA-binding IclR family transcriptional regulator
MSAKPATLQMRILEVLKKNKKPMRDPDIAKILSMPATSMRSSLYLLVNKGLVRAEKVGRYFMYQSASVAAPIVHTGARIVRLSHRNMQPVGEPPRVMDFGMCHSPISDL